MEKANKCLNNWSPSSLDRLSLPWCKYESLAARSVLNRLDHLIWDFTRAHNLNQNDSWIIINPEFCLSQTSYCSAAWNDRNINICPSWEVEFSRFDMGYVWKFSFPMIICNHYWYGSKVLEISRIALRDKFLVILSYSLTATYVLHFSNFCTILQYLANGAQVSLACQIWYGWDNGKSLI